MQALMDAGIHVIVAAGNSGPGCSSVTEPARYPHVIAVAALSPNSHNAARFSSRGPYLNYTKPNIAAPGNKQK
jgi:subtilisin family serine protease